MDKVDHDQFKGGDESIEDWLDGLEAKMEAMDIRAEARKIKWCKARIGSTGLQVLKGLEPIQSWDQAKTELIRYFGDDDATDAAWRNLEFYKAGSKSLGEIAADIARYARKASGEENTQQRLAVRAFINAIPKKMRNRLREKKIPTLKKALEEAKFLQTLQENSEWSQPENWLNAHKDGEEEEEEVPPQLFNMGNAPRVPNRPRSDFERRYPSRGSRNERMQEMECWACKQKGHFARECTLWLEFLDSRQANRRQQERRGTRQSQAQNETQQLNW